ncbi:hypothetical protein ABBQ32_010742 [Trebouxia sp. C0010 RCD-2024]
MGSCAFLELAARRLRPCPARQHIVPGSQAARARNRWQDLENDGLACVGESPGSEPGLSAAAPEPGHEPDAEGVLILDAERHLMLMPPMLLVAAYRFTGPVNSRLVWLPLFKQLADEWRQVERLPISHSDPVSLSDPAGEP